MPVFDVKRVKTYVWVAVAIQACFWISLHNGMLDRLFNDSTHRGGQGADFYQFYQAGANLLRGESIYRYEDSPDVPYGPLNKYPPLLVVMLGLPSQALSPETAYFIWRLMVGVMFILILLMIRRLTGPGSFQTAAALSLGFTPFYLDLYLGQTNTLMAVLLAWIMMALAARNKARSWPQLALSWNIKMNTLLLAPAYVRPRRIGELWRAVALGALLFLPYFIFFPHDLIFFFKYAAGAPASYTYQAGNLGMAPVVQTLAHLVTYSTATIDRLITGVSLAVVALSFFVFYKARHKDTLDHISLWMCTFFVGFRFIWTHHLVMLLPILALELVRNRKGMIVAIWLLLAAPTIFALVDLDLGGGYIEMQKYWTGRTSLFYHMCKLVPLVWLYILVAYRLLDKRMNLKTMIGVTAALLLAAGVFYSIKPHSSEDYMALALRAEKEKHFEAADTYFRKSIGEHRKYVDALFYYAQFLLDRGRIEEAERIRNMAREIAPDHPVFKAAEGRE